MRTLRDLWIEMSIREISTQSQFALLAWTNLDAKAVASNDVAFSSAHSFLSHAANVSKLLRAEAIDDANDKDEVGRRLGIPTTSIIHDRELRNHLEHYDERLRKWISLKGVSANIGMYNLGPKSAISGTLVFVTHYDPNTRIFTFVDKDFKLNTIAAEIMTIQSAADDWVAKRRLL